MPSAAWTASKTLAASSATSSGVGAEDDLGGAFDVAVACAGAEARPASSRGGCSSVPLRHCAAGRIAAPSSRGACGAAPELADPDRTAGAFDRTRLRPLLAVEPRGAVVRELGGRRRLRVAEPPLGWSRRPRSRAIDGDDAAAAAAAEDQPPGRSGAQPGEQTRAQRRVAGRPRAAGSPRRRARRARRRTPARGSGRSAASVGDQVVVVLNGLHRMPPSAWSRLGAAWCRRSTRRCRRTAAISALLEAGEELERDQLALARLRGGASAAADRQAALALLGALVDRGAVEVGGLGGQLGLAAAAAQLVERRVAGDPEEPGARLAAAGVEARALAVGALEGGRGDFLGRGAVAQQAGDVGVDVVAARAVEAVEGEVRLARRLPARLRPESDSRPYYGRRADPSQPSIASRLLRPAMATERAPGGARGGARRPRPRSSRR